MLAPTAKSPFPKWWTVVIAAAGGILFGYDIGIIAGALQPIARTFSLGAWEKSFAVASIHIGTILGAAFGGLCIDQWGRRDSIIAVSVLYVGSALLSALAINYPMLVAGRIMMGVAVSVSAVADCIYLSEIAPAESRGFLVTLNEVAIAVGILLAYVCALMLELLPLNDPQYGWRLMLGLPCLVATLQGVGMFFLPRTPRWLCMKQRAEEARDVLTFLRPGVSKVKIEQELQMIAESAEAERMSSGVAVLFSRRYGMGRRLLVGMGLVIAQQITGMPGFLYFAPMLLQTAGFSAGQTATMATVALGTVKLVTTVIAALLIESGRKVMLLVGISAMAIASFVLAATLLFSSSPGGLNKLLVLGASCLFCAGYAFGFGPVVWVTLAEIFPARVRGTAMALCASLNWLFSFLVSFAFIPMLNTVGPGAMFALFCALSLLSILFVEFLVPETQGMSLESISSLFTSRNTGDPEEISLVDAEGNDESDQFRVA